nr:ROK family protein [Armatimonadota bacterium]
VVSRATILVVIIGVDLGGTNVRGAAVSVEGELSSRVEKPSYARQGSEACLNALREIITEVSAGKLPDAVGIAIPGHIDAVRGIVHWAPNFGEVIEGKLRIWEDVDVFGPLSGVSRGPITIGNDANLAALGEYRFGCGNGTAEGFVLYTLGTGVGSGVIVAPKSLQGRLAAASIYIGHRGGAAEMGHVKVVTNGRPCGCGSRGCLETYCGTEGLLETAAECGLQVDSPLALFDAAEQGSESAREAWSLFGRHLGAAIGNTINTFAPEIVAIGGQVAGAWAHFADEMERTARQQSISSLSRSTRIVRAVEYEDAGILGAGALALGAVT